MTKQSEALRLAERIDYPSVFLGFESAAELRRLHSVNQELVHALSTMLVACTDDGNEKFIGHNRAYLENVAKPRAKAALAKAGESNV